MLRYYFIRKYSKKSQVALEFLTNYGWVFIVIAVVFVALNYFGVFDPFRILPNRCVAEQGINCLDSKIGLTGLGYGNIRIVLKN